LTLIFKKKGFIYISKKLLKEFEFMDSAGAKDFPILLDFTTGTYPNLGIVSVKVI
jgi:hypothetical protein